MSDGDALLAAVRANPAEDTPRLMYADWLEEQGFGRWAAFVRADVAFSVAAPDAQARLDELENLWGSWPDTDDPRTLMREHCPLLRDWVVLPKYFMSGYTPPGVYLAVVRRGFVAEVRLPMGAFLAHAKALFSSHPITRVRLTDRDPDPLTDDPELDPDQGCYWGHESNHNSSDAESSLLPDALFRRVPGGAYHADPNAPARWWRFAGWRAAYEALSPACVSLGRELAGLPQLPS